MTDEVRADPSPIPLEALTLEEFAQSHHFYASLLNITLISSLWVIATQVLLMYDVAVAERYL